MVAKLAVPTFITGPTDSVATIDIYNNNNNNTLNTSIQRAPEVSDNLNSTLSASKDLESPVFGGLSKDTLLKIKTAHGDNPSKSKEIPLSPDSIKNDLLASNPGVAASFKNLNTKYQTLLTDTKGVTSNITATISGVEKKISNATQKELSGLTNIINSVYGVACDPNLKNMTGLIVLSTNLIKLSGILGLKDSLKCIFSSPLLNPEALVKIAKNLIPHISLTGDLDMLKHLSQTPQSNLVLNSQPNFYKTYLYNYKIPKNTLLKDYSGLYDTTINAFTEFNPDWRRIYRKDKLCINASDIVGSSNDFKKLLLTKAGNEYITINTHNASTLDTSINTSTNAYMLVASLFQPIGVIESLKKSFPNTLIRS